MNCVPVARKCSKCLEISYCSQEHQPNDWSVHKLTCANQSNAMSSGCSSNTNLNQSEEQSKKLNSPQQESLASQVIFLERLGPEEDSDNKTPIDDSFEYTNHSHNQFKNLTGNTMSIGEVNMLNSTGGPNLNFK